MQLSSTSTVSPSSPKTTPPPAAPGSPCLARKRAANCANMPLCKRRTASAIHPPDPFCKSHSKHPQPFKGAVGTHSDESIPHSPLSLHVILTQDLVALMHSLPAREPFHRSLLGIARPLVGSPSARKRGITGRPMYGGAYIDASFSICSGSIIGREYLNRVVYSRDS